MPKCLIPRPERLGSTSDSKFGDNNEHWFSAKWAAGAEMGILDLATLPAEGLWCPLSRLGPWASETLFCRDHVLQGPPKAFLGHS